MTERTESNEERKNTKKDENLFDVMTRLSDETALMETEEKRLSRQLLNLDNKNKIAKFNLLKVKEEFEYKKDLINNFNKKQNLNTDEGKKYLEEVKFYHSYSKVESYFKNNFSSINKKSQEISNSKILLHNHIFVHYKDSSNANVGSLTKVKINIGLNTTMADIVNIAKNVNKINPQNKVVLTNNLEAIITDLNLVVNDYLWSYSPDITYFNIMLETSVSSITLLKKTQLSAMSNNSNQINKKESLNNQNNLNQTADNSLLQYESDKLFKKEFPLFIPELCKARGNINYEIDFIEISDINYSFIYLILTILMFLFTLICLININDTEVSSRMEKEIMSTFDTSKVNNSYNYLEYLFLTLNPNIYWTNSVSKIDSMRNCPINDELCPKNQFLNFLYGNENTNIFVNNNNGILSLKADEFQNYIRLNRINDKFRVVSWINLLYKFDDCNSNSNNTCKLVDNDSFIESGFEKKLGYGFNFENTIVRSHLFTNE